MFFVNGILAVYIADNITDQWKDLRFVEEEEISCAIG
jgi:hypothetical protein